MRKPNSFLVGAPKAGTTSIYEYLRQHPEVFMSPMKEPRFFSQEIGTSIRMARFRTLALTSTCSEKANNEPWIGEATPSYLRSVQAPKRIKEFNPASGILIMLRNPWMCLPCITTSVELDIVPQRDAFRDEAPQ